MKDLNGYRTIAVSRRGRIMTLTLDRPDKLNAVNEEMHGELATIFDAAADDPHSDIIVLTGAGRAFCAGGDILWMQKMIDEGFGQTAREARRIVMSLLGCDKPVIAKVNGHATGLGATIALFCDIVFASDRAKIGDPHVAVGLTAGDGGAVIWPQLIGFGRAKHHLLTGELLTATDAAALGLIHEAVSADQLDRHVDVYADRLAAGAQTAIRTTKRATNIALKKLASDMLDSCLALEELSSRHPDHQEAVDAFRDGRQPDFSARRSD